MTIGYGKDEKKLLENSLMGRRLDFTATYMALKSYSSLIFKDISSADGNTVCVLTAVLEDNRHFKQKKAYFLYREAAQSMVLIIINTDNKKLADRTLKAIKGILRSSGGKRQRAVAEAMGSFPLEIKGPELESISSDPILQLSWKRLIRYAGIERCSNTRWAGRSIVSDTDSGSLLVVKMFRHGDTPSLMGREGLWMDLMKKALPGFSRRFDLPVPVRVAGQYILRLENLPLAPPGDLDLPGKNHCLAFLAHRDYFTYPNEPCGNDTIDEDSFKEIMFRNAWLLGMLAGKGIIHTALIPLFHNRVQQDRRQDRGLYLWERGGRLDRWLESCRYPNFGKTGLRDFEHFERISGNRGLYHHIGSHLLSLVLVAGSFYRIIGPDLKEGSSPEADEINLLKHKTVNRFGMDKNGNPIDARILFNDDDIREILSRVFSSYYNGFTGNTVPENEPVDFADFSKRLTHEMGVDRYMEEVLRVRDQELMTQEAFDDYLSRCEDASGGALRYSKGEKDIITMTGPHLGGFNQKISLPELTDFLASASAICIADKYFAKKQML